LWHLQDRNFRRPIAELRLQIHCEAAKTPLHEACMDVLVYLVSDALTETAYLASVCELGSSLSSNECGLALRVNGFDDKLLDLFTAMWQLLLRFRGRSASAGLPDGICASRFEACLEVYRRTCSNSGLRASALSKDVRIRCLRPTSWSTAQKVTSS
jgi:secreted Zn-dependent insulinase-like peptidase